MRVLCAALLSLALPLAAAETCPPDPRGAALELGVAGLDQGDVDAVLLLAELAEVCPQERHVQYMAAMTLAGVATQVPPDSPERAVLVPLAMMAHARYGGGDLETISIARPDGTPHELKTSNSTELSQTIALLVLDTELANGVDVVTPTIAEHPSYCPTWWIFTPLREAFARVGGSKGAWALADRAVACNPNIRDARAFRADAAMKAAPHLADPAARLELLKRAREDSKAYLGEKKGDAWWGEWDTNALDMAIIDAMPPVPESDWFAPEWNGKPEARRAMAKALDAIWKGDASEAGVKPYRDFLFMLYYNKAMLAADTPGARAMICAAADDHASGRVRSLPTKALPAPPTSVVAHLQCPEAR